MQCLPLTLLTHALDEAGYERPTYDRAYKAAINALIPVKRGANGRWTFDPEDLPKIAERLGLTAAHVGE